jgi:hypothetical protein
MNGSNGNEKLIDELANLLNETAEAHHKAFAATEGEDPDWPIWYADYLLEKIRQMLKAKFTKSELIYLLVLAVMRSIPAGDRILHFPGDLILLRLLSASCHF